MIGPARARLGDQVQQVPTCRSSQKGRVGPVRASQEGQVGTAGASKQVKSFQLEVLPEVGSLIRYLPEIRQV